MSGAKYALVAFGSILAAGCANGLRQLAPPGIYKYEDLAQGQPIDPAIAGRVAAEAAEGDRAFPRLSEQPTIAPEGVAKPEREAMKASLEGAAQLLLGAVSEDRAAAAVDQAAADLVELQSALNADAAKDAAAAAADASTPAPAFKAD